MRLLIDFVVPAGMVLVGIFLLFFDDDVIRRLAGALLVATALIWPML